MPRLVSTGQITLTDVTDGLYARLSSESHVVPTNTDGSDGTYDGCSTTMSILLGRTDDSANWSVTASATAGVIGELVGKTYTVSNMTVDAGYVDITATRVGYPALTSRFSITKARRGFAGPAITLIASKQGFSFVDGIAEPADQSIAFTVVRHNATEPVVFYATGDASLVSDDGRLTLMNYTLGVPGVGNGDTAYLDLAQFGNNRQVTITAVCGDLNATQTVVRLDQSSAAAGATRNVHRGNWTSNTPYQLGDTVIYQGYGWSCTTAHTSSVVVTPPVYPVGFNDNWTLASVKGADSKSVYLTSSSYVFRIAQDGTVSPASIALTAVGQNIAGEPTFQVQTGTATLSGSGGVARTLTAANLTSEQATIKITWDGLEDFVTITKIREGSNGITVVSSNEAHVLPADKDGAVTSYANSGTTIQVFEGSVALNASSSATVSAFRVGTITQSPASTITVGTVSYAGTTATIPNHSAMANGTDSVVLTIPVTVYRADGSSIVVNKIQTISKSKTGATGTAGTDALTIVVSNEAHTLPASSTGVVSSYTNSGTTIQVFEGATALNAVSSIAANGQFTIGTPVLSPAASITVGNRTYSGTTATVAQHSMMLDATDSILITYPVSIRRSNGANVTINCSQTITKSKAGATGSTGASAKAAFLTATSQIFQIAKSGTITPSSITLTATGQNVTGSPTFTVTSGTATLTGTGNTRTLASTGLTTDAATIRIQWDGQEDFVTIVKVREGADGSAGSQGPQGPAGASGSDGITVVVSNEAHTLPAASDGVVASYTGSGTTIQVYEGATLLSAVSSISGNGQFTIGTPTQAPASTITVGARSYSGTTATVAQHSAMVAGTDSVTITYPITIRRANGSNITINKTQTITKSKAGPAGSTGAQGPAGPAVVVTANRALSFTATDGVLDGSQANIVLTAAVSGIASPTYAWTFSGLQTNPTASTTSSQTITAAQFGTSKSATVTCTVNGSFVDQVTIVRLEKSTAEAGATVGATFGSATVVATLVAENFSAFSGWTNVLGAGETVIVSDATATDGYCLSVGNNSGDDMGWLVRRSQNIPYDPNKLYRIRARCKRLTGTGIVYFGFEGVAANGTTLVNINGADSYGSQHYVAASGETPSTNWVEYVGYVKGFGSAGGAHPDPISPGVAHPNVAFIRPLVLVNYSAQAGITYIDYFFLEEVEPVSPNVSGRITPSNVTTYIADAAIGAAQIGSINLVGTSNFAVKTATSGARMDMDSRRIKVFDANGVLRVQLGDLTV